MLAPRQALEMLQVSGLRRVARCVKLRHRSGLKREQLVQALVSQAAAGGQGCEAAMVDECMGLAADMRYSLNVDRVHEL